MSQDAGSKITWNPEKEDTLVNIEGKVYPTRVEVTDGWTRIIQAHGEFGDPDIVVLDRQCIELLALSLSPNQY